MRDIATTVSNEAKRIQRGESSEVSLKDANDVFKAMHGAYGKVFLDQYATGKLDGNGHDQGTKSARMAWAHALKRIDRTIVAEALELMRKAHPSWPPKLGEFELLCDQAAKSLGVAAVVAEKLAALPCSGEAFSSATQQARDAARARRATFQPVVHGNPFEVARKALQDDAAGTRKLSHGQRDFYRRQLASRGAIA